MCVLVRSRSTSLELFPIRIDVLDVKDVFEENTSHKLDFASADISTTLMVQRGQTTCSPSRKLRERGWVLGLLQTRL